MSLAFSYKYSKDDEEIYKEFMEIANELIPHTVKTASLSPQTYREILQDPECFSYVLRFYDGICSWEEDSQTPVLHIGWAKPMVSTCSKFDAEVRARVDIPREAGDDEDEEEEEEQEEATKAEEGIESTSVSTATTPEKSSDDETNKEVPETDQPTMKQEETEKILNNNYYLKGGSSEKDKEEGDDEAGTSRRLVVPVDGAGDECDSEVVEDSQRSGSSNSSGSHEHEKSSLIEDLSRGCGEGVLNFEFLLGRKDSDPFVGGVSFSVLRRRRRLWRKRRRLAMLRRRMRIMNNGSKDPPVLSDAPKKSPSKRVLLELHSVKMRGLKGLLCAEKLNASAIQLQLTAQSQTEVKKSATGEEDTAGASGRPKRARRE